MPNEILTIAESSAADRFAEENGIASAMLMENAGRSVAEEVARRWPPGDAYVVCGPGNNGGDGFVAARHLTTRGWTVRVALLGERDRLKGDAALMASRWDGDVDPFSSEAPNHADVVVDALFGAGLARALDGEARDAVEAINAASVSVVAVDV